MDPSDPATPCRMGPDTVGPLVQAELYRAGSPARIRAENEYLYIGYEPLFKTRSIVRPKVQVDFGARSTGEPPPLPADIDGTRR